jgi:hypothetical protein
LPSPSARAFRKTFLIHPLTSAGPIPTAFDPYGYHPYPSFSATAGSPKRQSFRVVALENRFLKALICPDLGGRLHSLVHKAGQREVLYVPKTLKPARILPRMAFLPGGIEVSFPISHSPVQIEKMDWKALAGRERAYVWCGERELHAGMQWTIEFSLGAEDRFLSQRTFFWNPTRQSHEWMSWSNAALPARPDTAFHFPGGPVLVHDDQVRTRDWAKQGPRRQSEVGRMTGYFWKRPDVFAFGAFTPSLRCGLYHVAAPEQCPGIKLWTYGRRDKGWAGEGDYIEIQAGPLKDQSRKGLLKPGQSHVHAEFWLPTDQPMDIRRLALPEPKWMPMAQVPRFGKVRRSHSVFLSGPQPRRPAPAQAQLLAARVLRLKGRWKQALAKLDQVRPKTLLTHPQVLVEKDQILRGMGQAGLKEREQFLEQAGWHKDERLVERKALLLADQGRWREAKRLLENRDFQKIHQRYFRTELWKRVQKALGLASSKVPESLGEDDLARFGAYRDFDQD